MHIIFCILHLNYTPGHSLSEYFKYVILESSSGVCVGANSKLNAGIDFYATNIISAYSTYIAFIKYVSSLFANIVCSNLFIGHVVSGLIYHLVLL